MAELEGLINGSKWAVKTGKTPLVVEGGSHFVINLARRLQSGTSTAQVSKNWRWEGRLNPLRKTLTGQESILLSHVIREGNKVADVMANVGVESNMSFHAKESDDSGKSQTTWHRCWKLAEDDKDSSGNPYISPTHFLPMHASDSCHQTLMGRQTVAVPTPRSGPVNVTVDNMICLESS